MNICDLKAYEIVGLVKSEKLSAAEILEANLKRILLHHTDQRKFI